MLRAVKRYVKIIFVAAIIVGFVAFSIDNRQPVTLNFFPLPYSLALPEFLFAILCFILGALTGGVVSSLGLYHIKRQHKLAQQRVAALENETRAMQAQREEKLHEPAQKSMIRK